MRRRSPIVVALAAALAGMLPSVSAHAGPPGCTVATLGNERPEWFCEFYAQSDTVTFQAASTSGWAIDRLIRVENDGTIVYERLAGRPATDGAVPGIPDAGTGTVAVQAGWYIRVQVLASVVRMPAPLPPLYVYRNGVVNAQS